MASSGALAAAGVLGAGAIEATSVGTYYAINKPGNEINPTLVNPADQKRNQVQLPETNESVDRLETEDAGDKSQTENDLVTNLPTGQTSPVADVALAPEISNLSQGDGNVSGQTGVQSDASTTVNSKPTTTSTKDTGASSDSDQ
ncbi:hypothetical protein [Candidatus Mycoplasma haematohominis]|uniref:hypothetical protein n=1 Tax=Candidatus Mycoplasma haematohominis TaxID=1494318 RepID=UPI001C0A779C|nr:hypothetical protein [Candidatus Mycoplasma haemohominis]